MGAGREGRPYLSLSLSRPQARGEVGARFRVRYDLHYGEGPREMVGGRGTVSGLAAAAAAAKGIGREMGALSFFFLII